MSYLDIRDSIQDGDFIFFKAESLKQRVICWFTGGEHSHCGIASWLTDSEGTRRLMLVESFVGGCRMVTLSAYSRRGMDVVSIDGMDWTKLSEYVTAKTGVVHYGNFDFITIGLKESLVRLGLKNRKLFKLIPNGPGEVCSEMLADVLSQFKPMESTLVSPKSLYKLIERKHWITRLLHS